VALASIIYFSMLKSGPVLHGWLIPILLSITVPVTTLLLARTALFRKRMAGDDVPAEVSSRRTEKRHSRSIPITRAAWMPAVP
jgi:multicomponent K+:H+ antiporter subunit G